METKTSGVSGQTQAGLSAPSISLPKGGGAIRGIGEKFAANPVTGTGSMTVPLPLSPGRSGFGPQLSLSYDSGSGNGPFGFGWSLSIPGITRKTDKGIPQYRDTEESDVFILSGTEDLVPVLQANGKRFEDTSTFPGFTVHRYRPRVEGLFARIERWTDNTGDVHWRSITRDNVITVYGKTGNSRVADPADPRRVYTWLACEGYDDKGNAIVYGYVGDNDHKVDRGQANERNRLRTANRYLKVVRYGNRESSLIQPDLTRAKWLFEVVFDYDEAHYEELGLDPARPEGQQHRFVRAAASVPLSWAVRPDPFSSHRAGFEVRTYRRCRRVLMFHRFDELGSEPYLVRSTEFDYADLDYSTPLMIEIELGHQGSSRFGSFIRAVTQSGFVRDDSQAMVERSGGKYFTYLKKSLPPLEFEYSKANIQEEVRELDAGSVDNVPAGLNGTNYQWVDLEGEGVAGMLTEQADAWFYASNLGEGRLGPRRAVALKPSLANLASGRQHLLDLAGDGQLDLVTFAAPTPGFYERTEDEDWKPFKPFAALPNIVWSDPNLRFVDLNGDGHADVLVTEQDVFTWHPSLAEEGFGAAVGSRQPADEEEGPRLVLADGTQSVYLADMCGDGLTDLVRIRNGEVCYWPNLGYGRFGPKITMDSSPWFDNEDQFDQRRIHLADIDGSGLIDIIYLGRDGVRLYFNQSGNRWSGPRRLSGLPPVDNGSSIVATDLLGNGTACLVWSSPLPANTGRSIRYLDLLGGQKPHLLAKSINNLGAETHIHYVASTKFYLADKVAGRAWITRMPFPVHVVDRVVTYDHISGNRFVTRFAYHHGYFDGTEREFRGFGLVEQWDTEQFASVSGSRDFPLVTNVDESSHVPPVLTRSWFHTGVYLGRDHVSDFFAGLVDAGDTGEYYRTPEATDSQAKGLLLEDTLLPQGLGVEDEREACRALKGSMLRQEVFALDGTEKEAHPYTVTEQSFTVRCLQTCGTNRHGVFFAHPREAINYHYERDPDDPRVSHALTLEVDPFGNVLKEVAIGYGRRRPGGDLLHQVDRDTQARNLVTYTESRFTEAIDANATYRTPLPAETREYELTGYAPTGAGGRFRAPDFVESDPTGLNRLRHVVDSEINYEQLATGGRQRRLIEHVRTLYRKNDLTDLLPLGAADSMALVGERYKLAFTGGLLAQVFRRPRAGQSPEELLPTPSDVLGGQAAGKGGYLASQDLKATGLFPLADPDDQWWMPEGRVFHSPTIGDSATQELTHARQHFFVTRRHRDPFGQTTSIGHDTYDLLLLETCDAVGNRVTAGERNAAGAIDRTLVGNDYRVLQPRLVTDPNRNHTELAFDALGFVAGTAVRGKDQTQGDTLEGFQADLTRAQIDEFYDVEDPHGAAASLLRRATTRLIYDVDRFRRTLQTSREEPSQWLPAYSATISRESHGNNPAPQPPKTQISFSYSDGFGREIQQKIQAEPGPLEEGGPEVSPRWAGSGWTIFNNKGKAVRQYEPFFSRLPQKRHRFEFGAQVGVSPILFYDPVERVVATVNPNHTYEKVLFGSWRQVTYDVNDTVAAHDPDTGDPRSDPHIKGYLAGYFRAQSATWATWYQERITGAKGTVEQRAAEKSAKHAGTPTTVHLDSLGRVFLTQTHNGFGANSQPELQATRVSLDIEGNRLEVRDGIEPSGAPQGRLVSRYDYDMLGNRIHQTSVEAGRRWMLNDVTQKSIRTWDGRGHSCRIEYDPLRRPLRFFVTGADPANPARTLLTERLVYGEQHPEDQLHNLRGRLYLHCDQAGVVTNEAYDFKGNPSLVSRRLATDYKQPISWTAVDAVLPVSPTAKFDTVPAQTALVPQLAADTFASSTTYDALNRPVQLIQPRGDQPGAKRYVIQPVYNEANLIGRVNVWLDHPVEPAGLLDPAQVPPSSVGVNNVDYDAKGQRTLVEYGNGVRTTYSYDPLTFRLLHLVTRRDAGAFPQDCPQPAPAGWPGCQVQSLHYTYDPMGNLTHVRDDAQQTIYFRNKRVEPSAEYTYDAVYRLIEATGREHLGQAGGPPVPHSYNDGPRVGLAWSANDGNLLGRYLERYGYDAAGNILSMEHRGSDPAHPGWTRTYVYDEPSQLEPTQRSNRLTRTVLGGTTETYSGGGAGYDAHGNMLRLPHLSGLQWDYRDQLQMTQRQAVNAQDADGVQHQGERTWYVYDSAGQRVRKVTELAGGQAKDERIYLGALEIYRRPGSNALVRETLHIMGDQQRIALVETRTAGQEPGIAEQLIRYQYGNHLGSSSLELDHQGRIISYEEYTPYGSTSYQAVQSQTEMPKRYRYTGKERDEQSGLYYQKTRYYAAWLARWTSCDPTGLADGVNLYSYVRGNPVKLTDETGGYAVAADTAQNRTVQSDIGLAIVRLFEDSDTRKAVRGNGWDRVGWYGDRANYLKQTEAGINVRLRPFGDKTLTPNYLAPVNKPEAYWSGHTYCSAVTFQYALLAIEQANRSSKNFSFGNIGKDDYGDLLKFQQLWYRADVNSLGAPEALVTMGLGYRVKKLETGLHPGAVINYYGSAKAPSPRGHSIIFLRYDYSFSFGKYFRTLFSSKSIGEFFKNLFGFSKAYERSGIVAISQGKEDTYSFGYLKSHGAVGANWLPTRAQVAPVQAPAKQKQ